MSQARGVRPVAVVGARLQDAEEYAAHVSWLTTRPWRSDLALLVNDADAAAAMAETDIGSIGAALVDGQVS